MILMIITIVVLNLVVLLMPKRISKIEMYTTSLFALFLQDQFDTFLGLKYKFYHYFKEGPDLPSDIAVIGIYPAINMIFLNFFPYQQTKKIQTVYIFVWSLFAIAYEWIAEKTELFNYTGWQIWYSIPFYPVLFLILMCNLIFVRRLMH